jgi:hypothetical protein
MTLKVDGTNGVIQSYDYQVLTTGFSYTFAAGTQLLLANPAGTLATGTVTMPSTPADGMNITITSTQQIAALTINANTGQSIVGGGAILFPAGGSQTYVYRLSNTTWYSQNNTAAVVTSAVAGNGVAVSAATGVVTFSIAAPTAGSIGAYILGATTSAVNPVVGTSYGSMYNQTGTQTGASIAGTWRCVSRAGTQNMFVSCSPYNSGLFVRVS